jgi:hypothetical protein
MAVTEAELKSVMATVDPAEADFMNGAPPCLQSLARTGCAKGSRNNGPFNFAVLAKKQYGEKYREKVGEYNDRFMNPPLNSRELAGVVRSVGKKNYSYKCKEAPISELCDRATCVTRKHGVGKASKESGNGKPVPVLLAIIEAAGAEFWHSHRQAFVSVTIHGHREHLPVQSTEFRRFLVNGYDLAKGKVLARETLESALRLLDARAALEGPEHPIAVRVAQLDGVIYIDLGNPKREIVHIHAGGWEIVHDSPIRFHRPSTLRPLPHPVRGGRLDALRRFITIRTEDDWRLFVAFLLSCLRGAGPYPQLHLSGVQGSAKTTLARIALALIDPSRGVRAAPRDERDLLIAAKQAHLLAFDNLSGLSPDLSDGLCRLATGGGLGTRKLYTDDEEQVFDVMRPVVLNGIAEIGVRPDLRDRAFPIDLPTVTDQERKDETTLWAEFEAAAPAILGALYDAVSCALREWEATVLRGAPRMADMARWVSAAEPALGWERGSFLSLYKAHRDQSAKRAVELDAFATAVMDLTGEHDYKLTPTEMLEALTDQATPSATFLPFWPKTPRALTNALKRVIPDLEKFGVSVNAGRGDDRWIWIGVVGRTGKPRTTYEKKF